MGGMLIAIFIGALLLDAIIPSDERKRRTILKRKYKDPQIAKNIISRCYWDGITEDMVLDSLGPPEAIDHALNSSVEKKTYKYGKRGKKFLARIFVQDGVVTGWRVRGS